MSWIIIIKNFCGMAFKYGLAAFAGHEISDSLKREPEKAVVPYQPNPMDIAKISGNVADIADLKMWLYITLAAFLVGVLVIIGAKAIKSISKGAEKKYKRKLESA